MVKKILTALLAAVIIAAFFAYRQNDPGLIISRLSRKRPIQGGNLKYTINFLGIPLGSMNLFLTETEQYEGKAIYHLRLEAQTLYLLSSFFKASAVLDSYVDQESLNPVRFTRTLSISGKDDEHKEIVYDQANSIMLSEGEERYIFKNTQDPLSVILNFKKMDFSKVSGFTMNINSNQKNYILKGNSRFKNIEAGGKRREIAIIKAEIFRGDNKPYHGSSIEVTFLKEEENIPLLMKILANGFTVYAQLADIAS